MHIHHQSSYGNSFSRQARCENDLLILELLSNLLCPLAVNPGIPADFVALSPNEILDPHDLIYWGPKDVLKAYFKDPSSGYDFRKINLIFLRKLSPNRSLKTRS